VVIYSPFHYDVLAITYESGITWLLLRLIY